MDYGKLDRTYGSVPEGYESKAQDSSAKFTEERYYRMSYAKQPMRQVWQGTQDLYYSNDWEWIVSGEGFDRPVRFPTLRDFVKSLTDVFMQDPPDIELVAKNEGDRHLVRGKKAYIDKIRDSVHEKKVRRKVIEDMFFFGKGIRNVSHWKIDRDGKAEFDDIATRRIDPRDWFVDENCNQLHDILRVDGARDAIHRDVLSYSTYLKLADRYGWDQNVIPENWFALKGMDYMVTNSRELQEKTPNSAVKLYKYMNQEEDLLILTANSRTVFEGKMSKVLGTDRIPYADYTYESRNDSYWGNSLAQLIAPHIYLKDTLLNLELMNLKLTLQPVMAVSGDFGFNRKIHTIQPGGVWQAQSFDSGKIQDKLMPIAFGNPNTRVYEMMNSVNSELTVTTRSDLRSLEFQKKPTATQVMSQGRAQNAHNETIESINEIEAEAVLWDLALQVMASFMDEKDGKGRMRRVPIDNYAVRKNATTAEFVRHVGYSDIFDLTQDMIDVEAEIVVTDRRSEVARNSEKLGRIMQAVPMIGNFAQLFPDVLAKINGMGITEQLIEAVGMDIDRSLLDDESIYDDEFENLAEEILLGHDVEVPVDESRKDSLKRLRFLTLLRKKEKLDAMQEKAYLYHFNATMANITRDHSKDVLAQKGKETVQSAQQGPLAGNPNLPTGSAIAQPTNPNGRPAMTLPMPDERLTKSTSPESLV